MLLLMLSPKGVDWQHVLDMMQWLYEQSSSEAQIEFVRLKGAGLGSRIAVLLNKLTLPLLLDAVTIISQWIKDNFHLQ